MYINFIYAFVIAGLFVCLFVLNKQDAGVDLICLVTAQMSYYSNLLINCKNFTQKVMDLLEFFFF